MKDVTFIIPCYNASRNINALYASLASQTDRDWNAVFIDDMSTDDTAATLKALVKRDGRVRVIINDEKKFALRNIVEAARQEPKNVVAIIDGDDELCNDNAVGLLKAAHATPGMVVWTAHKWDINGMNISREMPQRVNPYQVPWVSSHLKTFDASLLDKVSDVNFKDHKGNWFERGYDQALFLPLLAVASERKYLNEVCYLYKINSCSVDDRDWAEMKQHRTINFIRSRGFVSG